MNVLGLGSGSHLAIEPDVLDSRVPCFFLSSYDLVSQSLQSLPTSDP